MIFSNNLISESNQHDLLFYRIGTILGIVSFPSIIFFYEYLYNESYPYLNTTIIIIIIYFVFLISTLIKKINKYAYLLSVISTYATTLFFVNLMFNMDFQPINVLLVSISISILASGFRTEKMMNTFLLTMISFSIFLILLCDEFSILTIMYIILLIIWPLLLYYMLKSKFVDKAKIEESSKFLQMVFKSSKDPTIIIDSNTLKIIDCSENTIKQFKVGNRDNVIGKTVREINKLYLNDIISNKKLLTMETLTNENIEFDLFVDNEKKFLKISPNKFCVNSKSYVIFTIIDITAERKQNSEIYNMAFLDELTKIDNRRSGISELKKSIKDYEMLNSMFAVYFVDIDRFKEINDNYGHECGDIILNMVANVLYVSTGVNDIVSRIGGDEFMIIVKDVSNIDIIDSIAQRIVNKVKVPIIFEEKEISVTISVGISIFPKHGLSYKDLMKNADKALYKAKNNGRNQYCVFGINMKK